MGLPHLPAIGISEEVQSASLGSFLQSLPRSSGMSTCDMDGMHGGSASRMGGNSLSSSLGDYQARTPVELSKFPDDDSFGFRRMEFTNNVHGLTIGSLSKAGQITPRNGRNIQSPASRIVGFESSRTSSLNDGSNSVSSAVNVTANEVASSGSLVKKRTLSPFISPSADQFNGNHLDIGCRNYRSNTPAVSDSCSTSHDHKKANVGSENHFTMPARSAQKIIPCDNGSMESFFTDGPLLEKNHPPPHIIYSASPRLDVREFKSGPISISPKEVISLQLSLSPLGPKFSERVKPAGRHSNSTNEELEDCHSTLKNLKEASKKSKSGNLSPTKEEEFQITSKSFEEVDIFHKEFHPSSLETGTALSYSLFQGSAPTSQCMRFVRSLSGLSVRRSLVGSFEESLLSGRFLSGKPSQVSVYICCVLLLRIIPSCDKL